MTTEVQKQERSQHIGWIDLRNDGILQEIAIMSRNKNNGDIYFIAINDLDEIDKRRIIKVLNKPDANKYPLWELMANTTMPNGQNTLEFFHQLVKIRTERGQILPVGSNKMGAGISSLTERPQLGVDEVKRGPGRPPKASSGD